MNFCENPEILDIMLIIKNIALIVVIGAAVILVVMAMVDVAKVVISGDADLKKGFSSVSKRLLAGALVFLVPAIVTFVMNVLVTTLSYESCINNANKVYISGAYLSNAEKLITEAEKSKTYDTLYKAQLYVYKIDDDTKENSMQKRLDIVKKYLDDINAVKETPAITNDFSDAIGGYSSDGKAKGCSSVRAITSEPDPSSAINYWANKGMIKASDFVYPKDKKTGKSLGAWPKKFDGISKIPVSKTYYNNFIFPTTPTGGKYHYVYEHNGIDIMANMGTPVYAPADGTLMYSTWGHTSNKGCDETAYSVGILLNKQTSYGGISIGQIFLTHMMGIVRRCDSTSACNYKIKAGELVGFTGNAAGSSTSPGYAPHLHMTVHPTGNYNRGLTTSKIEGLYSIPGKTSSYSIKAGA